MAKYKPILKNQKELLKTFYESSHDPNKTKAENIQKAVNLLGKAIVDEGEKPEFEFSSKMASVSLKALVDEMNGDLIHYYIKDNSLIDFLKGTEVHDCSIVKDYVQENSRRVDEYINRDVNYCSMAVHTQAVGYLISVITGPEHTYITVFDNENAGMFDILCSNKKLNPLQKFAINFLYYIKAYPEKIIDGVPDDMVKNDRKKVKEQKYFTIGIAEEIVDKTSIVNGRIISPHFRSGFFRHYTADRYKEAKGKVQFIAATMVKGKAKTVIS